MRIAYVTPHPIPSNAAMSRRMEGIALTLQAAGHAVRIISGARPTIDRAWAAGTVEAVNELDRGSSALWRPTRSFRFGPPTVRRLDELRGEVDAILIYGGLTPFGVRLLRWGRRNRVPVLADVVEWYQMTHLRGGPLGPHALNSELTMRAVLPRFDGLICISSFLADYYRRRGVPVVVVPPTLDTERVRPRLDHAQRDVLTLAYTGRAGKKDNLDAVASAVVRVDPTGNRIRLLVAGCTADAVHSLPSLRHFQGQLPAAIVPLGEMTQEAALAVVREADYIPLIREDKKFAWAGFPTKVVESMSVGTPMLGTAVGDLGRYLEDDRDALLDPRPTASAFAELLERALTIDGQHQVRLRRASRDTACLRFDFRAYVDEVDHLLKGRFVRA